MPFKRRDINKINDKDEIRLSNTFISGEVFKYLAIRSDHNNRGGFTKYSSFLIEELIREYARRNPNPKELINPAWIDQLPVTDKTLPK